MNFSIKWILNGKGGKTKFPIWLDIEKILLNLKGKSGVLVLSVINNETELQVRTEEGDYLLTLGEVMEDEYNVRSYWDPEGPDQKINILGDYWPARQLTKDFDFVVKVFKEFFDTGNVSKELLN
ncbi:MULTISPECIES: DUF6911 family protein [Photorhabdus]|uniref:Uncharacterized protein n=1 Tax=Photorhabdus luminescens subsp. sonorensis TaxID=1173677 RepID=A0A5C4RBV6_PHOLU|nr:MULTISPECIES: hypothetical protein [Photorhabdus]MCT8342875.1 hypothetical protein [Photorhabdus kleinii]TNH41453.1 hypothetical protein EP164_22620 [Photorhabdus luminescens subsp. sonorensis]